MKIKNSEIIAIILAPVLALMVGYFLLGIDRPSGAPSIIVVEQEAQIPSLSEYSTRGNTPEDILYLHDLHEIPDNVRKAIAAEFFEETSGIHVVSYEIKNLETSKSVTLRAMVSSDILVGEFISRSKSKEFLGQFDETFEILPEETVRINVTKRTRVYDPVVRILWEDEAISVDQLSDKGFSLLNNHFFFERFALRNYQVIAFILSVLAFVALVCGALWVAGVAYDRFTKSDN